MLNFSKLAAFGTLLGLSALAAAPASATPVTFVFSGLGTGIFQNIDSTGGNGFNNAAFSFSYATDTDYLSNIGGGLYSTQSHPGTVKTFVAGTGLDGNGLDGNFSATSTNHVYFSFLPDSNIFGLTDSVTGGKVFFAHSDTPVGSGLVDITLVNSDPYKLEAFQTSIGAINFTGIQDAKFSGNFAPVPEASSVVSLALLLSLGAGTLAVAARRKKAAA